MLKGTFAAMVKDVKDVADRVPCWKSHDWQGAGTWIFRNTKLTRLLTWGSTRGGIRLIKIEIDAVEKVYQNGSRYLHCH
jgi:hypothetical protein